VVFSPFPPATLGAFSESPFIAVNTLVTAVITVASSWKNEVLFTDKGGKFSPMGG
jgi:hypothetical protein